MDLGSMVENVSFLHCLMLVDTDTLVFICVSFSYSQDIINRFCLCLCNACLV